MGFDARMLIGALGLPSLDQANPYAMVPAEAFGRLWGMVLHSDPRPELPVLVGTSVPFGAFGLLDYLAGSAATVGDGIEALSRYFRLAAASVSIVVPPETPGLVWIDNEPESSNDPVSDSFTVGVLVSRFRTRNPATTPLEVMLSQRSGPPVEPFQRALGCPVTLGRSRAGFRYSRASWSAPLARSEPALHATLESLAHRVEVKDYFAGPVSYALRLRLPELLSRGFVNTDDLADSARTSRRTLQRRLRQEGTSSGELIQRCRRDEALRLLRDPGQTVGDIARGLGYSEPASFTRAFRRWYGMSPSEWRRRYANAPVLPRRSTP